MITEQALLLLIEDDVSLRKYLRATLKAFGYQVEEAASGAEGSSEVARLKPDMVLLDLGLPDMDGLEMLKALRAWNRVPVMIVSARDQQHDIVRALDLGADDYLPKPFGCGELLARIRASLRRASSDLADEPEAVTQVGPLKMDFTRRVVTLDGAEVHLSPHEFALLSLLVRNVGKVLTHHQLLREIGSTTTASKPNGLLRVHMANLRKKLEPDPAWPRLLMTEPGIGYRLKLAD